MKRRHVIFSRRGRLTGPIDELLADHGLQRRVIACTSSAIETLFLIKDSDMVGVLPASIVSHAVDTFGLNTFDIPLALPVFELDMAWHPRYQADLTHAWLRQCVRETVLS